MNRTKSVLALRPEIPQAIENDFSEAETFQNSVLRPILKFQHDLILTIVMQDNYYPKIQTSLNESDNKLLIVKNFIDNNTKLKAKLIGCVIGLFSTEEYEKYTLLEKELNKRIIQMSIQRFTSSL